MLNLKNNRKLLLLTTAFVVLLPGCYTKVAPVNSVNVSKQVNFRSGATINLTISNLTYFQTKSNDSVLEADLADVKSLSVFLTTNPTDPFTKGTNPFGDGVSFNINYVGINIISIYDTPSGGPYYAVVGAFDDVVGSITKNNICEGNAAITSLDTKWYVSANSVNVINSENMSFSDTSSSLDVTLVLRKPVPNSIGTDITVRDGTTGSVNTPIIIN